MKRPKELTELGEAIKKELLETRKSQKEFCQEHNIPEQRLSEILYGIRRNKQYREFIIQHFNLNVKLNLSVNQT